MNDAYTEMQEILSVFSGHRSDYENTLDETAAEQLNSLRVIKKEVLDLADLVDKMSGIVIHQHN
jgi:hypothetical protein